MGFEHDRQVEGPNYVFGAGIELRWWLRVVQGSAHALVGAVFTFGPPWWHSSGNFYYIMMVPVPFWVWSVILMIGGLLLLIDMFPYNWIPYFFLTGVTSFWGIAQGAAVLADPPPPGGDTNAHLPLSAGGPIWVLGIAAFNLLFLFISANDFAAYRKKEPS